MLLILTFIAAVSAVSMLPSAKEVCQYANDIPLGHCLRLMSAVNRVSRNSTGSVLGVLRAGVGGFGDNPDNCGDNADECDCTWGDEAVCGSAISGCIAACTTVALCAACLVALGPQCQDCACYYICEYDGPGKLATKVCPQKYFNCTDQ